jgi:hypothetical protein
MKKYILAGLAVLLAVGSMGYANIMTIQMSYFVPRAQSGAQYADSLWTVEFENMNFKKTSFENASFGLGYEIILTNQFSLVLGLDTYSKNMTGYYKDYVGHGILGQYWAFPNDVYVFGPAPLQHNFSVSITPIQASIKITPFGRRHTVIPYVGGGVALYFSRVRLRGDMVDFSDPYVYTDAFVSEAEIYPVYYVDAWEEGSTFGKVSFGWQVFGGFMVPVTNRFSIDAGFKYANSRVNLGESFLGFGPFDLGSYQVSLGVNYWF